MVVGPGFFPHAHCPGLPPSTFSVRRYAYFEDRRWSRELFEPGETPPVESLDMIGSKEPDADFRYTGDLKKNLQPREIIGLRRPVLLVRHACHDLTDRGGGSLLMAIFAIQPP